MLTLRPAEPKLKERRLMGRYFIHAHAAKASAGEPKARYTDRLMNLIYLILVRYAHAPMGSTLLTRSYSFWSIIKLGNSFGCFRRLIYVIIFMQFMNGSNIMKFLTILIISIIIGMSNLAYAQNQPSFSLPIDCELNITCFIQNYVDIDPSENVRDYTCNKASYNGHKGTDFRLLSTLSIQKGVRILAAASGVVKATRDGMADKLALNIDDPSIKNRECGNGVVIDHGNGWEIQYCHMKKGSVIAKKGELVEQGEEIGQVGYSGLAQFAQLHITVRQNDRIIDPFTGNDNFNASCSLAQNTSSGLWDKALKKQLIYKRGDLLQSGFSTAIVTPASLEGGEALQIPFSTSAPAIIIYARFINLERGDKISFEILGPSGELIKNITDPLERNKAHYVAYSGKKRPKDGWEEGSYKGKVKLLREGETIIMQEQVIEIK